jgi:hypothetical protein
MTQSQTPMHLLHQQQQFLQQHQSQTPQASTVTSQTNGNATQNGSSSTSTNSQQQPWGGPFPSLHLWPIQDTFQMKMIHLPEQARVGADLIAKYEYVLTGAMNI